MKSPLLLPGFLAALTPSLLTTTTTTTVLAQEGSSPEEQSQLGPFHLQIQSQDHPELDGQYLSSCHAGAAIQTLCTGDIVKPAPTDLSAIYYWNYTGTLGGGGDGSTDLLGKLTWNLPLSGGGGTVVRNVSLPLSLGWEVGSNVASTLFQPWESNLLVGFHNDTLFLPSWIDDSTFVPGQYPNITGVLRQLSHWHACEVQVGSYHYEALAWVTSGPPNNPTCKPVDVIKVNP